MILAKPVIPNKYWILRDSEDKIGNIEATSSGYSVKIHDTVRYFKTIPMVKKKVAIEFEQIQRKKQKPYVTEINGYPTEGKGYNAIYDVKQRLPLYTKEAKSKSWYAAGWYMVKVGSRWVEEYCPKLLTLKRHQFIGPAKSQQDLKFQ